MAGQDKDFTLECPLPRPGKDTIQLAHGGGGRWMHELLNDFFLKAFDNPLLAQGHDATVVEVGGQRLALTTDSYVVKPLFFPGGDIGKLAVFGTVNDLAMAGARPLYLSAGFILEEGFALEHLRRIVESMRRAADQAGVLIVTGDTKVVDRGKGDGVFINTAGLGVVDSSRKISPGEVEAGDAIILSGDIGRHGIAIMAAREGLEFETTITSDCASLWKPVETLFAAGVRVHCLRDLTRGGLATALNEISETRGKEIRIDEKRVPVTEDVRSACELLGYDPLYVANEGRFVAFVPEPDAERALQALGPEAATIGRVTEGERKRVVLRSCLGTERILDMLSGEQLPRIC